MAVSALLARAPGSSAAPPEPGAETTGWAARLERALASYDAAGSDAEKQAAAARALVSELAAARAALPEKAARGSGLEGLGPLLARACGHPARDVRREAWAAAAKACLPATVAALERVASGLHERREDAAALARVLASEEACADAAAVLVARLDSLWRATEPPTSPERKGLREGLDALLRRAFPETKVSRASWKPTGTLQRAVVDAARTVPDDVHLALATALASVPTAAARAALAGSLSVRRDVSDEVTVQVLEALGQSGDAAAVPLLVEHVADTPGRVLEAALVGLFRCRPDALAAHVRLVLDATIEPLDEDWRKANAMSIVKGPKAERLRERRDAMQSARFLKSMTLDARTAAGCFALYWKVVDSAPEYFRRSAPPFGRGGQRAPGVPITGTDWIGWWRTARR